MWGPYLSYADILKIAGERSRSEQYKTVTYHVESIIRRLAPRDLAWTLGDAGTQPMAEWMAEQGTTVSEDEANQ